MKIYNFFYRIQENGTTIEKPFCDVSGQFEPTETIQHEVLEDLLKQGVITAFGWTTTLPYSTSNN